MQHSKICTLGSLLFGFFLFSNYLSAQSLEEQYRAFQQAAQQNYTDFRDEANQKYADFLRGAWEYFNQSPAIDRPKEEQVPPVIFDEQEQKQKQKQEQEQKQEEQIAIEEIPIPAPGPKPQPIAPIEENTTPSNSVSLVYQGTSFSFRIPTRKIALYHTDGDALANAWEYISTDEYDNLLYDCVKNKENFRLCDWAYFELIGTLCKQIYGDSNEATFLQAFILTQSGYAARLAIDASNKLYVLVGSHYQLYGIRYFSIDGLNFYPLDSPQNGLHICSGYFEDEQPFTLVINPEQGLKQKSSTMNPRKSNMNVSASCTINLNTINFYNSYPSGQVNDDCGTRWAIYANAPMEECVRQSLYPTLEQAIRGVPEAQAVNKLLNWVQTAFEYEYDDKVWGHDRAFFPSESLYYPYCDCEDRSILFSRIVRDLLGLDVVLLYYPGHLATAVAFNQDVKGDYIMLKGTKYIVCDPTYIGAPIGMTMPGMDNQTAKVIKLTK